MPVSLGLKMLSTDIMSQLVKTSLGLFLVVGVILIIAWLARRFMDSRGVAKGTISIIDGVSVGQRERVVLVQVGVKRLLLGVAPGSVCALYAFDSSDDSSDCDPSLDGGDTKGSLGLISPLDRI